MRRFLLCTALLMAVLSAANAKEEDDNKWRGDFRKCKIHKTFSPEDGLFATITPDDLPNMQKWIIFLKQCDKFWTCVRNRDDNTISRGKRPKHCYAPRDKDIPEW
jgi:hypothetical protein